MDLYKNDVAMLIKLLFLYPNSNVEDEISEYLDNININDDYNISFTTQIFDSNVNLLMALLNSTEFNGKKELFDKIISHKDINKIINSKDSNNNNLLHHAIKSSYSLYKIVDNKITYTLNYYIKEIINLGVDVKSENKDGKTPLMLASENLDLNSVKLILKKLDNNPNKFDYDILINILKSNIIIYEEGSKEIKYEMYSDISSNRDIETKIKFNHNINYDVEYNNKFSILQNICKKYNGSKEIIDNTINNLNPLEYAIKYNNEYMLPILLNGGELKDNFELKKLNIESLSDINKEYLLKMSDEKIHNKLELIFNRSNKSNKASGNKIKI